MLHQFASDAAVMQRALELAACGVGRVEPNPPVGAVAVDRERRLLGEGWHQEFGGPHAEVFALQAAGDAARGGTLFVTLEPCCHFGKTPPCTQAIIAAGIARVVAAVGDPAPHVSGGGFRQLREAGIVVETGLLEREARTLLNPFFKLVTVGRPWVHAKWAMTCDGRIATRTGHSQWISGDASRAIVHRLRGRMDAIVVGIGTVLADNPLLTARPPGPRQAARVVLDSRARLPRDCRLVHTAREVPVLCAVTSAASPDRLTALTAAGVELLTLESVAGQVSWDALLQELGRRRMTHVLLEGGAGCLGSAFDAGLIDEWHVFVAPKLAGGAAALSALGGLGREQIAPTPDLTDVTWQMVGDDAYLHGVTRR